MKKTTKRKILAGALRRFSPMVTASVPVWLIAQKFPLWAVEQESTVSLTGAGVIAAIIAFIALRKKIFGAIKAVTKKCKGVVLGTVILSMLVLGICSVVRNMYPVLPDIETICMGGVVSGIGGVGLEWAAMAVAPKKESDGGEKETEKEVEAEA